MAAAALLRSVASKMSRASAAPTHHHSLVARGLHGEVRSGPATFLHSNQVQQGTADVLVSASMAAATGLRSGAGQLTTKMAHAAPPPPYQRLVHGRGIHSRTSPDPIPSTPQKVLDTTALDKATAGMAYIALFGSTIYVHFWLRPSLRELRTMIEDLPMDASSVSHQTPTAPASAGHGNKTEKGTGVIDKLGKEEALKTMHSQENHVKELEATIMDLKAEIAELKIALDSSRSQGKV